VNTVELALYIIFFISCIVLVAAVLLQPGKTNAGALFTSNVSSNAFAPRGTATILSKFTIGAATVFMVSALLLAMPAISGTRSVLDTQSDNGTPSTVTTTDAPVAVPATEGATESAATEQKEGEAKDSPKE
jgi:preprotein translocase subunit SecG